MDQREAIRQFVKQLLESKGDAGQVSDQTSLLLSGRLQSLEAIEIVVFLEESFGVDFGEIGFDQEKIDTIDSIAALVGSMQ